MMLPCALRLEALAVAAALAGCLPADAPVEPRLDRVDLSVDGSVEVVDRVAALDGAVERAPGSAPDLAEAPGAFFLQIDGADVEATLEDSGQSDLRGVSPGYQAVVHALAAVAVADLATVAVVGPPAAAIAFAADGELTEHEPWLWSATNTATGPLGGEATVDLAVAWVGVGWLAEMRLTTSDGAFDDTLWFSGFLAVNGAAGWWDLYQNDDVVGVVEWTVTGPDQFQAGIAAVGPSPEAGDLLLYAGDGTGTRSVSYYDAGLDFLNYVLVFADDSGEVALHGVNGGAPMCWDTTFADAACPAP